MQFTIYISHCNVHVQFCLVGMKAVCSGPEGCNYNNKENCVVTPLSSDCGNPMWDLNYTYHYLKCTFCDF